MSNISASVLDFALPRNFIILVSQPDILSVESISSTEGFNTNSLFTVTENDFAEMDKFTRYANELQNLSRPFFEHTKRLIQKMNPFTPQKRDEAEYIDRAIHRNIYEIYISSEKYYCLCKDIKNFCQKIDNLTEWYIQEASIVLSHLDDVKNQDHKYGKVNEIFEKCGKDISILTNFFVKWSKTANELNLIAQGIENRYCDYNRFFQKDLEKQINFTEPNINKLIEIFRSDTFIYLIDFLNNCRNLQGAIAAVQRIHGWLPKLAISNMFNYLGHIGTYFNMIYININSTEKLILNAEGAESLFALYAALKNSKEAWQASEKCSCAFIEASSKYIK